MRTSRLFLVFFLIITGVTVRAQNSNLIEERSPLRDRIFFGGNLGFAFGDITFIEVAPLVGYRFTDKLSGGVQVQYRYRNDKRFTPDLDATDYGANLFARYNLPAPFFLQAEYEYLNFEFFDIQRDTRRESFSSVLVGGGMAQPLGRRAFLVVTALYNLSYDDTESPRPYDNPLILRIGINAGF
ncbi:MAG: hypothetical protein AAF519_08730 [Bacteroidota bacterium]